MLKLPKIALVVYAGNYIKLTDKAMADVVPFYRFDQVLVFGNEPLNSPYDTIVMPFTSIEDATRITWREVYPRLKPGITHVLGMQWDGYPIDPAWWRDDFRQFDFIGAPWPWLDRYNVGNTGFCLQSKRLLGIMQTLEIQQPEDQALCRVYRPYLEQKHNIYFAPAHVAELFSTEHGTSDLRSFGFHGIWNMLYFMDDGSLMNRINVLSPKYLLSEPIQILLTRSLVAGRFGFYRWLHARCAEAMEKR